MDISINHRFVEAIELCINNEFAKNKANFGSKIGISASRISEIIGGRMGVSSEICKSLYIIFKISPE
jgi:plasmid maintenance system antidote protein VapI